MAWPQRVGQAMAMHDSSARHPEPQPTIPPGLPDCSTPRRGICSAAPEAPSANLRQTLFYVSLMCSMPFLNNQNARIYWDEQGQGDPLLLIMGLGYPSYL